MKMPVTINCIKNKHCPEGSTGMITYGNLLRLFSFMDHSAVRPTSNKYLLVNRTMTTNKGRIFIEKKSAVSFFIFKVVIKCPHIAMCWVTSFPMPMI